jgi:molybdate transport system substrate-binding protein
MSKFRSALAAMTAAGMLMAGAAQAADIHVIASGALKGAFAVLIPQFEQASGHQVRMAWGPSSGVSPDAIPVRLRNHEPVDVLIMVAASLPPFVGDGRFLPTSRVDLAQSGIGVGVRSGAARPDIATPAALRLALLRATSIGYSEGASGTYISKSLFKQLGIEDQVASKIHLVKGKELVGEVLARGEVELGLQQISELRVVPGVDYVGPLPAALQKTSVLSAVQASDAPQPAAARQLLAFLTSPAAAAVYRKSGLDPVGAE